MDLRQARAETFEPHVGSEFRSGDPALAFTLAGVTRLRSQPHAPRAEPFALVFTSGPGIGQGIFALEHSILGRLTIFLVPIGSDADGRLRYEAVFN
jgi:hypothetical protein